MEEYTLMRFKDAAELEAYLKGCGYQEVFRHYDDGIILVGDSSFCSYILLSKEGGKGAVSFVCDLDDETLEAADECASIEPFKELLYDEGGLFWYGLDEFFIQKSKSGEDIFSVLLDIGEYESRFGY